MPPKPFQRAYKFFNQSKASTPALQTSDVSCCTAGRGSLVFGDSAGFVTLLDRDLAISARWRAHEAGLPGSDEAAALSAASGSSDGAATGRRLRDELVEGSGGADAGSDGTRTRKRLRGALAGVSHVAVLQHSDVLVTVGGGWDPRPALERATSRATAKVNKRKADRKTEGDGDRDRDKDRERRRRARRGERADSDDEGADGTIQREPRTVVKVWRLDRRNPKTDEPLCVRTMPALGPEGSGAREVCITSLAVLEDLSQIALGLSTGRVLLLRGQFYRERTPVAYEVLPLPPSWGERVPLPAMDGADGGGGAAGGSGGDDGEALEPLSVDSGGIPRTAITFLAYTSRPSMSGGLEDFLYVTTAGAVLSYCVTLKLANTGGVSSALASSLFGSTAGPQPIPPPNELDLHEGGERNCVCLADDTSGRLVVGRTGAVFFFTVDDRGGAYAFGDAKTHLAWFRSYLLVASRPPDGRCVVNVYDLNNRFIAMRVVLSAPTVHRAAGAGGAASRFGFSQSGSSGSSGGSRTAGQGVRFMVNEWGNVFILTTTHAVWALAEKDTNTKLKLLFTQARFDLAIMLAKNSDLDDANIQDIFRMYGDHLYSRGDPESYDKAIEQYTYTIGHVEPSYVIRRFLDAQRIHNLTTYLAALHEKGAATEHHTTLLLNCYTKLKKEKEIRDFIHADDSKLQFDVDVAIGALRDAGYANAKKDALYLAERHGFHGWYLKIQVEDLHGYDEALRYIRKLTLKDAQEFLKAYGKRLVSHRPRKTTELLKKLCTIGADAAPAAADKGQDKAAAADKSDGAAESKDGEAAGGSLAAAFAAVEAESSDPLETCDAEVFIPLYDVDKHTFLKRFLEHIVAVNPESSTALVWNTLLELCLTELSSEASGIGGALGYDPEDDEIEGEPLGDPEAEEITPDGIIPRILRNPHAKYDEDHALVLVQMHGFREGQLCLYERLKMFPMVVQHYMEVADSAAADGNARKAADARRTILSKCREYEVNDPNLWVQVLSFFVNSYRGTPDEKACISEVLATIDEEKLLPPLLVISVVSENADAPLGLLRKFILHALREQETKIARDAEEIAGLRKETEMMHDEMHELQTKAKVFRPGNCHLCGDELELPAVHFLCEHSFHQNCLAESKDECPLCIEDQKHVLGITRRLGATQGREEEFFHDLTDAEDGFAKVAEYLGKGVFMPPAEDDGRRASLLHDSDSDDGVAGGAGGYGRRRVSTGDDDDRRALFG